MKQYRFARLHRIRLPNQILDGATLEHGRSRLLLGNPPGNLYQLFRWNQTPLRITAKTHAVGNTIANRNLSNSVTDCLYDTSAFVTNCGRKCRNFIEARSEIDIDKIETSSDLSHNGFAGFWFSNLNFLPLKDFGATIGVDSNSVCHDSLRRSNVDDRKSPILAL